MESRRYGATPAEWESAAASPLMPWIVPIVSNPNVPSSAASKAMRAGRGKVPSEKNAKGEAIGLRNWTNRSGNTDLDAWRNDADYGFGVRLGRGGLVAVDCDCDDADVSENIREMLFSAIKAAPPLRRRGTCRWACILRFRGRETIQKKKYTLPVGVLEILGDGQQLACAGTHPSGARYEWERGEVGDVKEINFDDFTAFCDAVEALYGGASPIRPRIVGDTYAAPDRLADWLREQGKVKSEGREGELYIECPWAHTHGEADGETSTVYFPVGSNGYDAGGFKCLHAHCADRGMKDFIAACKSHGYTETDAALYPDMSGDVKGDAPVVVAKTTVQALQAFVNEKTGEIKPCMQALEIALIDPAFCGYEFAFDTFAGEERTRNTGGDWVSYKDTLATEMRITLERLGFKTPKKQDVIDMIKTIAARNTFDSLIDYLNANIPQWDGVNRVPTFFHDYCGAELSEWTISVSLYLFTALWARMSNPDGCEVHIAPVIIGTQGAGKTTLVKSLALKPEWCGEINFAKSDDDLSREMCKKTVMEIPELGNMSARENNSVKAFITKPFNEWVPKFVEAKRVIARRCVFIVTTNDKNFLTDYSGNRRWAPVEVKAIKRDAVQRDLPQLFAEAREHYAAHGVMFQDVERLQGGVNTAYEAIDPWRETLSAWLASNPNELLTTKNVIEKGLRLNYAYTKKRDANAVANVMRNLGYDRVRTRIDGKLEYVWKPVVP